MISSETTLARPVAVTSRHLEVTAAAGEQAWRLAGGRLGQDVPACPEWRIRDVVYHLGNVAGFVAACVAQGAEEPEFTDAEKPSDDRIVQWASGEWNRALDGLAAAGPGTPAWNWSTRPRVAPFWARCLTHEAFVHTWDLAESAGETLVVPADVAADGVDEILDVHLAAGVRDGRLFPLSGRAEVHSTDTGDRWLVETTADGVTTAMAAAGEPADVRLEGTAERLYLDLWGRVPLGLGALQTAWAGQLAANWSTA